MDDMVRPRPALDRLHDDQEELIRRAVWGFDRYQDMVLWMHDLSTISLGMVESEAFLELGCRTAGFHHKVLMNTETDPDSPVRHKYLEEYVQPPLRKSWRSFWSHVTEYGEGGPDPDEEPIIALRPSIQELHNQQREVLKRGVEGFGSQSELELWTHDLTRATLGVHDDGFVSDLFSAFPPFHYPPYDTGEEGVTLRLVGSVKWLLPWFNAAMRRQAKAAKEQTLEKEKEIEEYELSEEAIRNGE